MPPGASPSVFGLSACSVVKVPDGVTRKMVPQPVDWHIGSVDPPKAVVPYRLPSCPRTRPLGLLPSAQFAAEQKLCTTLNPVPDLLIRKSTPLSWDPPMKD